MTKHFLNIITVLGSIYLLYIELTYIFFKFLKRDSRFVGVGLFKYAQYPVKTLKGNKIK